MSVRGTLESSRGFARARGPSGGRRTSSFHSFAGSRSLARINRRASREDESFRCVIRSCELISPPALPFALGLFRGCLLCFACLRPRQQVEFLASSFPSYFVYLASILSLFIERLFCAGPTNRFARLKAPRARAYVFIKVSRVFSQMYRVFAPPGLPFLLSRLTNAILIKCE